MMVSALRLLRRSLSQPENSFGVCAEHRNKKDRQQAMNHLRGDIHEQADEAERPDADLRHVAQSRSRLLFEFNVHRFEPSKDSAARHEQTFAFPFGAAGDEGERDRAVERRARIR